MVLYDTKAHYKKQFLYFPEVTVVAEVKITCQIIFLEFIKITALCPNFISALTMPKMPMKNYKPYLVKFD